MEAMGTSKIHNVHTRTVLSDCSDLFELKKAGRNERIIGLKINPQTKS